jgi:hypothetical protein
MRIVAWLGALVLTSCSVATSTGNSTTPPLTSLAPLVTTTATPISTTTVTTSTTTATTTTTTISPRFEATIEPVTADVVWATWREGCPLHYSELSLLTMPYWTPDGIVVVGQMTVNSSVAEDVVAAFEELFHLRFPIERIALVDDYGGDDKAAMAANVTSGFNCRYVDGTERWSNHAFGLAVDINPLLNPWVRGETALPVEGEPYVERDPAVPGMINAGDATIAAWERVGWSWGGTWQSPDYMHFSQPGN